MKHLFFVAQLIEEAHLAEAGVDLFVGTMPADIRKGIMLVDPLTGHEVDDGLRGFFDTQFQIIARDPDVELSYARLTEVIDALSLTNVRGDGISIAWLRPATLPIMYPRSESDQVEVSVRMRIGFAVHVD